MLWHSPSVPSTSCTEPLLSSTSPAHRHARHMHPNGTELLPPNTIHVPKRAGRLGKSEQDKRTGGRPEALAEHSTAAQAAEPGLEHRPGYLHDLESPAQAAKVRGKGCSSSSACCQAQGRSGRVQRAGCLLGCATSVMELTHGNTPHHSSAMQETLPHHSLCISRAENKYLKAEKNTPKPCFSPRVSSQPLLWDLRQRQEEI